MCCVFPGAVVSRTKGELPYRDLRNLEQGALDGQPRSQNPLCVGKNKKPSTTVKSRKKKMYSMWTH